ncbi:MAG TPA: DciA family protein [Gammaproteobacteria bacterium]|nr:DciA family protein [Gammaproteobacteria bacterium]
MKDTRAVPIQDLISGVNPTLSGLVAAAREIKVLNRLLDSALSQPLRSHLKVANVQGDRLVIQCDSPAWSARARLLVPRLLESINRGSTRAPIRNIQIITRPGPCRERSPAPRRTEISGQTRRLLENVAAEIDNPRLRRALFRLAKRAR